MKQLRGVMGWLCVAAIAATLGACDDPKKNCHDIANKYDECAPKIMEEALKALPPTFEAAIALAKEESRKKVQETVDNLRAQCSGAQFSDKEKRQFRIWRACIKKDCSEFTKCIQSKK